MACIDPDNQKTWPSEVAEFVRRAAAPVKRTARHTSDLLVLEGEERFVQLLRGSTVRTYHCTRLLDHELAGIRANGLRRLTADLVLERIDKALECKAITPTEAEQFHKGHAFAIGEETDREGRVCLFSNRQTMDDAHSVKDLLGIWGGEAIYSHVGTEWEPLLKKLGRPAVVAVDLDVNQPPQGKKKHYVAPSVLAGFISVELGFEDPGFEIHFMGDIPATHVADIWTPGHPEYDRHRDLPRR
jgi:hypothetical protein